MNTFKKIVDIAITVIIVLLLVASVLVIIANIARDKDEVPNFFGTTFFTVASDSMTGTFEEGDMVVGKLVKEDTVITANEDIVSFYDVKNGQTVINTHRVVRIEEVGNTKWYYTQGDKQGLDEDPVAKSHDQLISVYTGKIAGMGNFVEFLRQPIGFILVVVLPIVAVIGWEIYRLIALYMEHKRQQILEESKTMAVEPTDEMKSQIIQEYLKSLNNGNQQDDVANKNTADTDKQ